jgi:hypothetical protein
MNHDLKRQACPQAGAPFMRQADLCSMANRSVGRTQDCWTVSKVKTLFPARGADIRTSLGWLADRRHRPNSSSAAPDKPLECRAE